MSNPVAPAVPRSEQPALPAHVRAHQEDHRHPEPDRHPEALVRGVPADGRRRPRARKDLGLQAVFKSVFPIKDFNETASLEFVSYTLERAEVRRRRVPPARHDVRRAAQGDGPARHLGRRPGERRPLDQEREGAGGLLRRDPADDPARHVHHQRHRARHRLPAAPLARASSSTTTRARRTPAASCSTRRASSRTAARGSTSSSTRRTSSTSASTGGGSSTRRCCCARSA